MSRPLSAIPIERRRQLSGLLGLFAALLVAAGAVAATGASTAALKAFVVIALVAGVLLALMAWGVAMSVRQERADRHNEQRVDAAIQEALAASGLAGCGCGHDHDPEELHVADDPCAHDGAGVGCSHSCDTCVFRRVERTAANAVVGSVARGEQRAANERGDGDRPRPSPRPSPR